MLFSSFAKMGFRFCFTNFAIMALFLALSHQTTLGKTTTTTTTSIKCEALDKTRCSFAVSWSGKRCVLENTVKRSGEEAFTCRTSDIEADRLQNIVETEQCVEGCGLDRNTLGISSDSLLDPQFTRKLCSSPCYDHCLNVVDLFFNLAAEEGVFLPKLCEVQGGNVRREMSEIKSSEVVTQELIQPVSWSIEPTTTPESGQLFSSPDAPTIDRMLIEVVISSGPTSSMAPANAPAIG